MSARNPVRGNALDIAIEILMQVAGNLPGWDGPSRTQFDRDFASVIARLDHANELLGATAVAEEVVEMLGEVALV